jgi:hypothetical protein
VQRKSTIWQNERVAMECGARHHLANRRALLIAVPGAAARKPHLRVVWMLVEDVVPTLRAFMLAGTALANRCIAQSREAHGATASALN